MRKLVESKDALNTHAISADDFIGVALEPDSVAYLASLIDSGLVTAPSAQTRELRTIPRPRTHEDEQAEVAAGA